jgi:hypothetical protein
LQEQAPNRLKLHALRAPVVSVEEKAGRESGQVGSTETSVSKPLLTCRKFLDDVKTGGSFVTPGKVWGEPVYCPHGVRHRGGVTVLWASVWNAGTCRSDTKGAAQVGGPHKGQSTEAEHRGGVVRSRGEGAVMALDRRDDIVWEDTGANLKREEPYGSLQTVLYF